MGRRRILLRGGVVHGIVVVVGHVGASRAVRIVRTVGRALLVGVGGTLLVAIVVICVVGVIRRPTILLGTVIWTAKDLIGQSDVLHARRLVWRLRIWR